MGAILEAQMTIAEQLRLQRMYNEQISGRVAQQGETKPKANGNGTDPRDSLTIPQIKEQLDEKGVDYPSTANKSELLQLLKEQE